MNAFYWLPSAFNELRMQFSIKRQPSDRDFLWLTLLSMLVLLFALLMASTRDGLSERMVDLLLGRVPGHGIPVWVRANPYTSGGKNLIDTQIVNAMGAPGLQSEKKMPYVPGLRIYPYAEMDHVTLALPPCLETICGNITHETQKSQTLKGLQSQQKTHSGNLLPIILRLKN